MREWERQRIYQCAPFDDDHLCFVAAVTTTTQRRCRRQRWHPQTHSHTIFSVWSIFAWAKATIQSPPKLALPNSAHLQTRGTCGLHITRKTHNKTQRHEHPTEKKNTNFAQFSSQSVSCVWMMHQFQNVLGIQWIDGIAGVLCSMLMPGWLGCRSTVEAYHYHIYVRNKILRCIFQRSRFLCTSYFRFSLRWWPMRRDFNGEWNNIRKYAHKSNATMRKSKRVSKWKWTKMICERRTILNFILNNLFINHQKSGMGYAVHGVYVCARAFKIDRNGSMANVESGSFIQAFNRNRMNFD